MPGGRFPPVPEHGVAHHPSPRRKVSNRQEARQAKKQAEDDVLQLAQLPPSLDSTRSLAAQLAAYGESLEVEEEFAKRERKWRGSIGGDGDTGGSDSESYFSARSDVESMRGSRPASAISSSKSKRKGKLVAHSRMKAHPSCSGPVCHPARSSARRCAKVVYQVNQFDLR